MCVKNNNMITFEETNKLKQEIENRSKSLQFKNIKIDDSRHLINLTKFIIDEYLRLSKGTRKDLIGLFIDYVSDFNCQKVSIEFDCDKYDKISLCLLRNDIFATNIKARISFEEFDKNRIKKVVFDTCE